jgi:hypothetical protein
VTTDVLARRLTNRSDGPNAIIVKIFGTWDYSALWTRKSALGGSGFVRERMHKFKSQRQAARGVEGAIRPVEPIDYGAKGEAVANLHAALLFLINDKNIDQQTQRTLVERLEYEWRTRTYGQVTLDIVKLWQGQLNNRGDVPKELLPITDKGQLDQGTANALNWLLAELGALPKRPGSFS